MDHSPSPPSLSSAQDEVRSPKTLISCTSEVTALLDDLPPLIPPPECSLSEASMIGEKLSPSSLASVSVGPLSTDDTIIGSPDHSNWRWQLELTQEEDYGGGDWENLCMDVAGSSSSPASNGNWRPWPTTCPDSLVVSDFPSRPSNSCPDGDEIYQLLQNFKPLSQCDSIGTDSKPLETPLGAGLANMGNTCFLNAIFQCFTHTVPFVQGLCLLDEVVPGHHGDAEFCLLSALRNHIFTALSSPGNVLFPSTLVNNLSNISSCFRRNEQEDAHEFLQCVLDKLENCWSKCSFKAKSESSAEDNLVKQVFGGRLVSQLHCCNCGHCSDTYEPLIDLSLEIENADDLDGALRSFTKVEEIEDEDVKITCDSCKEKVPVKKQLMLDQAPSILTFHLKRFKSNGYYVEKLDKVVEYPLELDLTPFTVHKESHDVELKYELYAVVVHNGWSSTSGHYFSYIRASPESWYEFDDSKVIDVQPEVALSQRAYILFYARKGTNWPCSLVEALRNYDMHTSPKSVLEYVESSHLSSALAGSSNVVENQDKKEEDSNLHVNVEVCKVGSCMTGEGDTSNESSGSPLAIDEILNDVLNGEENIDKEISEYVKWAASESLFHDECNSADINCSDVEIVDDKDSVAASSCNCKDAGSDKKICNSATSVRETDLDSQGDDEIVWINGDHKDLVAANSSGYEATGGDEQQICNNTSSVTETNLGSKGPDELTNCNDYHLFSPRTQRFDNCSEELQGSPRTQRPDGSSEMLQEARTVPDYQRDSKRQSRMSSLGKRLNKTMNQRRKEALRTASRFSRHRRSSFAAAMFSNPGSAHKRRKN